MFAAPTVVGDLVVAASCVGAIYGFERESGKVAWQYDIRDDAEQSNFHGNALIIGDYLYVGADGNGGGSVYSVRWRDGERRWRLPLACRGEGACGCGSDIVQMGDRLLATTLDDTLLCIDRGSGRRVWSLGAGFASGAQRRFPKSPAVGDGVIFFGGLDGTLRRLTPSGEVVWALPLDGSIETSVVHDGRDVYAGTSAGSLFKVDAASGTIVKRLALGGRLSQPIALEDGLLAVFVGWSRPGGDIVVADTSLEEVRWRRRASEGKSWTTACPYVDDGLLIVGDSAGRIFECRLEDGAVVAATQLDGAVRSIGITAEELFVGTIEGKVVAIVR